MYGRGRLTPQTAAKLGLSSSVGAAQDTGTAHCRMGPLPSGRVCGAAWRTGHHTLAHGTAAACGNTEHPHIQAPPPPHHPSRPRGRKGLRTTPTPKRRHCATPTTTPLPRCGRGGPTRLDQRTHARALQHSPEIVTCLDCAETADRLTPPTPTDAANSLARLLNP